VGLRSKVENDVGPRVIYCIGQRLGIGNIDLSELEPERQLFVQAGQIGGVGKRVDTSNAVP
jgi:hypothetical protein